MNVRMFVFVSLLYLCSHLIIDIFYTVHLDLVMASGRAVGDELRPKIGDLLTLLREHKTLHLRSRSKYNTVNIVKTLFVYRDLEVHDRCKAIIEDVGLWDCCNIKVTVDHTLITTFVER